ncbi:SpvB-domain-containing protein [Penicillium verhagenii]|nr:SpvB-domain-containing protein [Penicillium verhagenii]
MGAIDPTEQDASASGDAAAQEQVPSGESTAHQHKDANQKERDTEKSSSKNGLSIPSFLSLGKGGGAMRSIGESFKVNACNGAVSLSFPLPTSASRSHMQPSLSLSYDSGSGNGPFGQGWSLGLSSINRKTGRQVPLYDQTDRFLMSDGKELIPALQCTTKGIWKEIPEVQRGAFWVRQFRPRVDGLRIVVERWTNSSSNGDAEVFWRTITGDNITSIYGRTAESRISEGSRIFSWLLCEQYDSLGNAIIYRYKAENDEGVNLGDACERNREPAARTRSRYLKSIRYGNKIPNRSMGDWKPLPSELIGGPDLGWMFELILDYGEHRSDSTGSAEKTPTMQEIRPWITRLNPFSQYKIGFEVRQYRLCQRFLLFHHFPQELGQVDTLVSATCLDYDESQHSTLLRALITQGVTASKSGADAGQIQSLPPFEFKYSIPTALEAVRLRSIEAGAIQSLPSAKQLIESSQWVDLSGEGVMGILTEKQGCWYYQRNDTLLGYDNSQPTMDTFGPVNSLGQRPQGGANHYFEDLTGSGHKDLVFLDSYGRINSFSAKEHETGGWSDVISFSSIPNFSLNPQSMVRLDLTGNSLGDLAMSNEDRNEIVWFPSLAKQGFGPELCTPRSPDGPSLISHDERRGIMLADMTGDGLIDIVDIRNGRIAYWPNLGYGRFGAEVIMDNSPHLDNHTTFSRDRIRLLDLNGTGVMDLVYLPPQGGVVVHYNLAGNGWSERMTIDAFPAMDNVGSVFAMDLLGKGTACICWSGPDASDSRLHFLDFAHSGKPHLLTDFSNGLGAQVTFEYQPSTRYLKEDEARGQPWKTTLPFPVHVVSSIKQVDFIAETQSNSTFRYHHGYFDPEESEFRGFGMVEEWTQEYSSLGADQENRSFTTHTKSWFHLGCVMLENQGPTGIFAPPHAKSSFVTEPFLELEPENAFHALKGQIIRTETYCDDGSDKAQVPLSTKEQSYRVMQYQPSHEGRPGTFQVTPRQSVSCQLDRINIDPKIQHDIMLETNAFGDTTRAVTIYYGRPKSDLANPVDVARQQMSHIIYTETSFTNAIQRPTFLDDFRIPQVASVQQYRIVDKRLAQKHFEDIEHLSAGGFAALLTPVYPWTYSNEDDSPEGPYRILISECRTYYSDSRILKSLVLQSLETYSVVDQEFELILTPPMMESVYGALDGQSLESDISSTLKNGGFVDLDGDGRMWKPSDRQRFSTMDSTQLSDARSAFYVPTITIDPLKRMTRVFMDSYYLLPIRSVDAVGNVYTAEYTYHHLQPVLVYDLNGNQQQYAYNGFGNLTGLAVMGKHGETVGDSLESFNPCPSEEDIITLLADPSGATAERLLGQSSECLLQDKSRYWRSRDGKILPTAQIHLSRMAHCGKAKEGFGQSAITEITVKITYCSGTGAPLQQLSLVDPVSSENRWLAHEWAVVNSHDKPVVEFQSQHRSSHEFVPASCEREHPAKYLLYDSLGRPLCEIHPDHTWTKVQYMPWTRINYDAGDTILMDPSQDPDVGPWIKSLPSMVYTPTWLACHQNTGNRDAMQKSSQYANTPTQIHWDCQGKKIVSVEHAGAETPNTRFFYDWAGHTFAEYDPLGRCAQNQQHDLQGNCLRVVSMDAGSRFTILNCFENPIISLNSRGVRTRTVYDHIHRPLERHVTTQEDPVEHLHVRIKYGEQMPNAHQRNLNGKIAAVYDQSGFRNFDDYDFKGNLLSWTTIFAEKYKETLCWELPDQPIMQRESYRTAVAYDAHDRPILSQDAGGCRTRRRYNLIGQLRSVASSQAPDGPWMDIITKADYNSDGQRLHVEYGSRARSEIRYDSLSGRLLQKRHFAAGTQSLTIDKSYTYDCLGRVTNITDAAQPIPLAQRDHNARIKPDNEFTYDSLGRLVTASGRETTDISSSSGEQSVQPYRSGNPCAVRRSQGLCRYTEHYQYDLAGNILRVQHETSLSPEVSWTRDYRYEHYSAIESDRKSNRLTSTTVRDYVEVYQYEGGAGIMGYMTAIVGTSQMGWDVTGLLRSSQEPATDDKMPRDETTWYVYNSDGVRVRTVTEQVSHGIETPLKVREITHVDQWEKEISFSHDDTGGMVKSERASSRLVEQPNESLAHPKVLQIAILRHMKPGEPVLVRYQTDEGLELDNDGLVLSYEEYSPWGVPTYALHSDHVQPPRHHLYASYSRDQETGLYHCNKRYYAPWLGRWLSPDPLGTVDGLNMFCYVHNDPTNQYDPQGTAAAPFRAERRRYRRDRQFRAAGRAVGRAGRAVGRFALNCALERPRQIYDAIDFLVKPRRYLSYARRLRAEAQAHRNPGVGGNICNVLSHTVASQLQAGVGTMLGTAARAGLGHIGVSAGVINQVENALEVAGLGVDDMVGKVIENLPGIPTGETVAKDFFALIRGNPP